MRTLEDALGDIVAKARRGQGITEARAAQAAGLRPEQVLAIERYELTPDDAVILKLAGALRLKGPPLVAIARNQYLPEERDLSRWGNVEVVESLYSGYAVNAYIVWDKISRKAVLFDTGADITAIRRVVSDRGLSLDTVALTHTHRDHIAVLDAVVSEFNPRVFASRREPVPGAEFVRDSDSFEVGSMRAVVRETDGHSPGGLTFVVSGTDGAPPLAVVGDALFAGSAGGANVSYERLHANIRSKILTLPDDTLILPGHGPVTTVGEERAHNPFAP